MVNIKQLQQKIALAQQFIAVAQQTRIKLFLDDDTEAPVRQELFKGYDVWVTTPEEAIEYLSRGNVSHVSLDHDLGLEPESRNGYMVAKWIEEAAYNSEIPPLKWRVHSFNPKGKSNMITALQNADKFWSRGEE
jgi:hypothetical protein